MIQMQEQVFFSEKDVFKLTLWEVKDEKGLESVEGKEWGKISESPPQVESPRSL